jgi:hypothetical protein
VGAKGGIWVCVCELGAPKLLNRLKCEFEVKTAEEQGVGARSLACSIWGGVKGHVGAPGWD